MRRDDSIDKLHNTLGFFCHGIPAIFVRSDIIFSAFPNATKEYPKGMAAHEEKAFFSNFELAVTPFHEARHFHDALLSFPLFELFVMKFRENICIMQLSKYIKGLSETELPIKMRELHGKIGSEGQFLLEDMIKSEEEFNSKLAKLFSPKIFNGNKITLSYLFETNAILTEIMALTLDHGIPVAQSYYENVVLNLPPEYKYLIKCFLQVNNEFVESITALHYLVSYCIYFEDDPVAYFIDEFNKYKNSKTLYASRCNIIDNFAQREAGLKKRIGNLSFGQLKGNSIEKNTNLKNTYYLFDSLSMIYECRSHLVNTYVNNLQFSFNDYLTSLIELPIPPVVFFPSDADILNNKIKAVYESDLVSANKPYYTIAGVPEAGNMKIAAGMTTLGSAGNCLSFDLIDLMLVSQYCYHCLFKGNKTVYNELIDLMYNKIFKKHYLRN